MRIHYIVSLIVFAYTANVSSQNLTFTDPAFRSALLSPAAVLDVNYNPITLDSNSDGEIQPSEADDVYFIQVDDKGISSVEGISGFPNLVFLDCQNNLLSSLDLSMNPAMQGFTATNNSLTYLNITNLPMLTFADCQENDLQTVALSGLSNLKTLLLMGNPLTSLDVSGLSALEQFVGGRFATNVLDFSNLEKLEDFHYSDEGIEGASSLEQVDLSGCPALLTIGCMFSNLSTINLDGCTKITNINLPNNKLTAVDLNAFPDLLTVDCRNNLISSLTCESSMANIILFDAGNNELTELNLAGNFSNASINFENNLLTSVDLSRVFGTYSVDGSNNLLTFINLKNGVDQSASATEFFGNPVAYMCVDDSEMAFFSDPANTQLSNYNVNSYCSFVPGGTYYTIQGTHRIDFDGDGCDSADDLYPQLKLNISNGTASGTFISGSEGLYDFPVPQGTHTIIPELENPYYTVVPASVTVTFPNEPNPFNFDFCVTRAGEFADLHAVILPINAARPGFDSTYKLIYKNVGTVPASGNVVLTFDSDVLEFVTADVLPASQSGNQLTWEYNDLAPLESRSILVTLNLNSPIDTPPLNDGSQLDFSMTVTPVTDDMTVSDNTFSLKQDVVNSMDPNDKVCLEGNIISPDKVGDFVHYVIRFENTGTAAAENIVVKDLIDLTRFDITTLTPVGSSHDYILRISQGNRVEFIFEGIDLPYDDAGNDGMVAYKIKTLPFLQAGDSFENTASIYFDYNFPAITNTASTVIQSLGIPENQVSDSFAIYPNPAGDLLNIASDGIDVSSIKIYNAFGQLVVTGHMASSTDVSQLPAGHYFVKLSTETGDAVARFIKL